MNIKKSSNLAALTWGALLVSACGDDTTESAGGDSGSTGTSAQTGSDSVDTEGAASTTSTSGESSGKGESDSTGDEDSGTTGDPSGDASSTTGGSQTGTGTDSTGGSAGAVDCVEIEPGRLSSPDIRDNAYVYVDDMLGTEAEDQIEFSFWQNDEVGRFDLSMTPNDNFETCQKCIRVFEDGSYEEGSAARYYYASEGILEVSEESALRGGTLEVTAEGVRLYEVMFDELESIPVPGGRCIDLVDGVYTNLVTPAPEGWTCDPLAYDDGDCDCGCGVPDELDCDDSTLASCDVCDGAGSCSEDFDLCPGLINADDNTICDEYVEGLACVPADPVVFTRELEEEEGTVTDTAASSSTLDVQGVDGVIYRAILTTRITHEYSGDLDITLTSPSGRTVLVTTDNGSSYEDVFDGTEWNDYADDLAVSFAFSDGVVAEELVGEGRFSALRGEDPNGTWTLDVVDDAAGSDGVVRGWSLSFETVPVLERERETHGSQNELDITDDAPALDTLEVASELTAICGAEVTTSITHTYNGDLTISLISPQGTRVVLADRLGSSLDDVFDGTSWSDEADTPASDYAFTDAEAAPALIPREPFVALDGEDPNGTWTLDVTDNVGGDDGVLAAWTLDLISCTCEAR